MSSKLAEKKKIDILPLRVITTVQREKTHGNDVGQTTKPCDRCQLPQAGFEPARIIALGVIAIYSPGALPIELSPRIYSFWLINVIIQRRPKKLHRKGQSETRKWQIQSKGRRKRWND
ncbi:hypothetical protein NQ318_003676 [Aromia moschata]|uniref:Uncharacterized protein n=1 Tax=Aromia moschata TaxID=1265417 RepID=A0AAV8XJ29_9CUCU|nr:hypothetical protein NQ318_003676 [Aromia moschata]